MAKSRPRRRQRPDRSVKPPRSECARPDPGETSGARIRVLWVDDHTVVLESWARILSFERGFEWLGCLPSADMLVATAARLKPDVVMLDIDMPGPDPFGEVARLYVRCPSARVIMCTAYVCDHYVDQAMNVGVWGYVSKCNTMDEVLEAIRRVAAGDFAFSAEVQQRLRRNSR